MKLGVNDGSIFCPTYVGVEMLRALECDFATTKLSWFIFATKMPLPDDPVVPSPPRVFADSRETIIFHRRADRCCCIFKAPRSPCPPPSPHSLSAARCSVNLYYAGGGSNCARLGTPLSEGVIRTPRIRKRQRVGQ